MADKGYYYLKLKEDFFDTDELRILESMENGYLYSNILLKLYLKALKNGGKLTFNEFIPYNVKMLATITGHNVDVIEKAIKIFQSMHLIEILDNGAIYMMDMQKMIGSISNEGVRKAEYRERIKLEKEQGGTNLGQCPDIISISSSLSNSNSSSYKEIIDYLNKKIGTTYKATTKKTQQFINARLKEGFSVEDFKKVIDNKASEWLNNAKMQEYLRPQTLFGTNFESYLNSNLIKNEKTISNSKHQQNDDYVNVDISYIGKYGETVFDVYPRKKGQTEWTEEDKERILKEKGGKRWIY